MEEEIMERLEKIYTFKIDVKYRKTGLYDVYCKIGNYNSFVLPVMLNKNSTLESNVTNIQNKIDNQIVKLYKKINF